MNISDYPTPLTDAEAFIANDPGGYVPEFEYVHASFASNLERQNAALREALKAMTERYVALINSGEAGHWNPEDEEEVKRARAAIAATTESQ